MTQKKDTGKDPLKDIGYTPFLEPVTEREYTKGNINDSDVGGELEEPIFIAPSLEDFEEMDNAETEGASPKPKKEPATPFNPQYSELGNKEKQMGAEMLADVSLDGYKKLCKGMGSLAKVSETKLEREFAEGKIDPNLSIPIDEHGNTARPKEYFEELNHVSEKAFEVSDEFVDNVRPPLIRIFKKRGIGLTDEQLVLYYTFTDLSTKGIVLFQLKKSTNGILENMRMQTEYMRTSGNIPTPPHNKEEATQARAKEEFMSQDFIEPEETTDETYINEQGHKPEIPFTESKEAVTNPKFGDQALLNDMERVDKENSIEEATIIEPKPKLQRKPTKLQPKKKRTLKK